MFPIHHYQQQYSSYFICICCKHIHTQTQIFNVKSSIETEIIGLEKKNKTDSQLNYQIKSKLFSISYIQFSSTNSWHHVGNHDLFELNHQINERIKSCLCHDTNFKSYSFPLHRTNI